MLVGPTGVLRAMGRGLAGLNLMHRDLVRSARGRKGLGGVETASRDEPGMARPDDRFDGLLRNACRLVGAASATVILAHGRRVGHSSTLGVLVERRRFTGVDVGRGVVGAILVEESPQRMITDGAEPALTTLPRAGWPAAFLGVPLDCGPLRAGALCLVRQPQRPFGPAEERTAVALAAGAGAVLAGRPLGTWSDTARIAEDLHDGVAQTLFSVGLSLQTAALAVHDPDRLAARLADAQAAVDATIRDIRRFMFGLRPGTPDALARQLRDVGDIFRLASGLEIEVDVDPVVACGLAHHGAEVLQLAREAVANAVRHSRGRRVAVRLWREGGCDVLAVTDDGVGFDGAATRSGGGLANMLTRAERMGGRLVVASSTGGTTLRVELPVHGAGGDRATLPA